MFIIKAVQLLAGLVFMITAGKQPPPEPVALPSLDELLSYECARSISTMVQPSAQTGPVFSDGVITLTSIEARDASVILILNAGAGTYAVSLEHEGVNRLRFYLPTHLAGGPRPFYLSYMPPERGYPARVLELSMNRPPNGRDDLDYTAVAVSRADKMLEHYDYAIFATVGNMLNALTEGRVARNEFERQKPEHCEQISRSMPALARTIRRELDVVEMIVMGPKPAAKKDSDVALSNTSRMPASTDARRL
jgi:hypothetical protein